MDKYVNHGDICVCCGRYVPEGTMICNLCSNKTNNLHLKLKKTSNEMEDSKMKKVIKWFACIIAIIIIVVSVCITLTGCSEAERVSYNLSKEADYFNQVRQVTVINCIQGDVLFQMTGKISITADTVDHQLEIIVEDEYGRYKKHFIGLSDNVTYVVEDITADNVDNYKYTLNFNPKMWLPVGVGYID